MGSFTSMLTQPAPVKSKRDSLIQLALALLALAQQDENPQDGGTIASEPEIRVVNRVVPSP